MKRTCKLTFWLVLFVIVLAASITLTQKQKRRNCLQKSVQVMCVC